MKEAELAGASKIPAELDVFTYATANVTEAAVPGRFRAELPATIRAFEVARNYPPQPMIAAAVCAGERAMLDKVKRAVESADRMRTLTADLAQRYVRFFKYCGVETFCDWVAEYVVGAAPVKARQALWPALAECRSTKYLKAALHEDAPDMAILDLYFGGSDPKPYHPRLGGAARRIAATGEPFDVRKVSIVLARYASGPRALETLFRIHDELTDETRRARLGLGLGERDDKRSKALFAVACAHSATKNDVYCSPRNPALSGETDEKPASADELARCALKPIERRSWEQQGCLGKLAAIDRGRAVKVAAKIAVPKDDAAFELKARTLRDYPEAGALEAQLRRWKLIPEGAVAKKSESSYPSIRAARLLEEYGRAISFDVETGMFPNEHDGLLAELAPLAAELKGVVFEEVAPDFDAGGPYTLVAYFRGKRFGVTAENHGDWYDVAAVLGLLNVLLREVGSEVRYATLPTGDQTALVLAGPAAGLFAASQAKVIRFEGPAAGMTAGKAFEDYVHKKLKAALGSAMSRFRSRD